MKNKWIILFCVVSLFGCENKELETTNTTSVEQTSQPQSENNILKSAGNFQLAWQDDFNESSLDENKWSRIPVGAPDWKNYMTTDDQVFELSDGYLYLKGITNPDTQADPRPYLTGGVWTRGKFNFTYGKVEVRAKMEAAQGCWPAIWLLGSTSEYGGWPDYGEIDLMEHLNFDNFIYSTIHSNTKSSPSSKTAAVNTGEFNVYGAEWYPDRIVFTINGTTTFTYYKETGADWRQWPFDRAFHIILSQQLGGSWVGNVNASHLPVDFIIDFVKYYEYIPNPTPPSGDNQLIKIQMNGNTVNSWDHLTEVTLIHEGTEYNLPVGHNAPSLLGDGIGINGASSNFYGLNENGLLEIDLGQGYEFDAVKLGVYNGDGRTYPNVEVSTSSDGSAYSIPVIQDVQSHATFTLNPIPNQYIKIQMHGSTANMWSHLTEVTLIQDGTEFVMPAGHDAPSVLGDGIGVNGASTGYFGLDSSGLLLINLGQAVLFDSLKLGVYNGGVRTYEDVEVSLSSDGVNYGLIETHDVQNYQVFF
ncbi:glycosyl hydrolase family 16 [Marinilabilia salmonicolor]|jgi:beta-glucanase (GH16 family)|uniref:glycoside hydrolase family 16 protein n=1 Tax=Marinilabilia salmonicolor TaxID=989 RepID=UPI000D04C9FD|nr:glycoside hydrolase family 16 protein [Marinilabilia salmonicolor]PRZ01639.1 glycosyl hydrolase family 16 [Marinilabilia salmonicolor]